MNTSNKYRKSKLGRTSLNLGLMATLSLYSLPILAGQAAQDASKHTKAKNAQVLQQLPFHDTTDFENAKRGFITTLEDPVIRNENGSVAYDISKFEFLEGDAPSTVNPSLWRQGKLNQYNGLYKVRDGVYQIRSFDLANMTVVRGKTGWILIDPLLSPATSKAGMALIDKHLGKRPVTAIIITHSHIDHFGGIRGVVDEADISSGKIPLYAPEGFYEHAISENVLAGNAMARRASYMFGNLLAKNAKGNVGSGLAQTTASGLMGILPPTHSIGADNAGIKIIDGIEVDFLYTPDAEAPAEMMFYFPKYKTLCQAEIVNHTFHNLYTPRGAQVRNGQKWSKYIDQTIQKWGDDVEYSFGTHHWPTWGNKNINELWEKQRDLYRFTHDQTVRLANRGLTPKEIAETLKLPASLNQTFANRDYYGTLSHNIKAQYQLYYGWFDGNPANLNPLPPVAVGKKYVALAGGEAALLEKAQAGYEKGEYRWVAELLNHAVFANPKNKKARQLLANTYEQLGYMAESGPWRNFYLTGAKELRNGVKIMPAPTGLTPDMIKGLSTELFFDYIAMRFKGTDPQAAQMDYRFNISLPDSKEKIALLVGNGVVNTRYGKSIESPTANITVNRKDLNRMALKQVGFVDLLKSGGIRIDGNDKAFKHFFSKVDNFDFWFNIVTP